MAGIALSHTQHLLWMAGLVGGVVVVVAVAVLLSLLIWLVKRIDKRVVLVRDSLKAASANTANTNLIGKTALGVDAVLAEGLEHHLFLGRVLGKVRS